MNVPGGKNAKVCLVVKLLMAFLIILLDLLVVIDPIGCDANDLRTCGDRVPIRPMGLIV
jgi:hypothetical protein